MLTDDTVGAYLGGESADASAHMGGPTLMDMSAGQTQPLDESTKIEDPDSKTTNDDDVSCHPCRIRRRRASTTLAPWWTRPPPRATPSSHRGWWASGSMVRC